MKVCVARFESGSWSSGGTRVGVLRGLWYGYCSGGVLERCGGSGGGVGGSCKGWVGCCGAAIGGVGCAEDGVVAVDGVWGKGRVAGCGGCGGGHWFCCG